MSKDEIEQTIQTITDKIVANHKPEKIILFGSQATGATSKDSDVDLFIVTNTDNPRRTAREIDSTLWDREVPLDIIVSTPEKVEGRMLAGDFFIQEIMSNGKVLYAR